MYFISNILKMIITYILGYILFIFVFSTTQYFFTASLGLNLIYKEIFIKNFFENFAIYTIIYIIILFFYYSITLLLIRLLNKKLKK